MPNHVRRHRSIDFAGQFNEPRVMTEFASFPSAIKRVNGNAVPGRPRVTVHEVNKSVGSGFC